MRRPARIFPSAILLLLCAISANAGVIVEDFTSTSQISSADAVVNIELGEITPPLMIYQFDTFSSMGPYDKEISAGDGRHGVFDSSTYQFFDQDGDDSNSVIEINTDDFPDGLQVTSFILDAGMTLRPVGATPLVIQSLGDIIVRGTIDCSGGDGGPPDNTPPIEGGAGGIGRCGSAHGGKGGWDVDPPEDGDDISASVTGGKVKINGGGAGGVGGGGGGAHFQGTNFAQSGNDPNAGGLGDGGAAGSNDDTDIKIDLLEGGAGGAGGDQYPGNASGGGGGAGGGVIVLIAARDITVEAGGSILADGGDGGGDNTLLGGGGGGGGGGTIFIAAGRNFTNNNVMGPPDSISAKGGIGGVTNGGAADGGAGSEGRIWITDNDGGSPDMDEYPVAYLYDQGIVSGREDAVNGFQVISKVIDTKSSRPKITDIQLTQQQTSNNTVEVYVASGDTANFTPNWQLSSTVLNTELKRFIRFRVVLRNTDYTQVSASVQRLEIHFDPYTINTFEFAGGCGRVSASTPWWAALLPLLLPLFFAFCWRWLMVAI